MTSKTAKEFASQASNASSAAVCSEILANATEALQQLYEQPVSLSTSISIKVIRIFS